MATCPLHHVEHSASECRKMKSHDRRRQRREAREQPSQLDEADYLHLLPKNSFELARSADPRCVRNKAIVLGDVELTANRKLYMRASEENRRRLIETISRDRRA